MKKIKIYFQQVCSTDRGDFILIKIPDISMADFIRNAYIRAALDADFGPSWVVVWGRPFGTPSFIAKQPTKNVDQEVIVRCLDREWKQKSIPVKSPTTRKSLVKTL